MHFSSILIAVISFSIQGIVGQVLEGNYGSGGLNTIPDLRAERSESQQKDTTTKINSGKSSKTISEILTQYKDNYNKVIGMSKDITMKMATTSTNGQGQGQSCTAVLKSCQAIPVYGSKCYIDCLIRDKVNLKSLINVIQESIDLVCKPIKTVYLRIFDKPELGYAHLKSYKKFLDLLGVTGNMMGTIVPQLANAMNVNIIKYMETNLMPLRHTLTEIENELAIQQPLSEYLTQNNPGCYALDMYDAIDKFIDAFNKEPTSSNILLPGFAFASAVSKYVPSKLSYKMTTITETLRMFTGSAAGFACSPDTDSSSGGGNGQKGNCDELGRAPFPGFPIPAPIGGPEITGMQGPVCEGKKKKQNDDRKKGKGQSTPESPADVAFPDAGVFPDAGPSPADISSPLNPRDSIAEASPIDPAQEATPEAAPEAAETPKDEKR